MLKERKSMNVYDWDNTIYRGDSTYGFIRFLYVKRPKTMLNIPRTTVCGLLFVLHIMPKMTFKQNLFHMFTYVDDMEAAVDEFTSTRMNHVKKWYKDKQKEDDVVISASPEFLIRSFCEKTGIKTCMASPVDMHTGKYIEGGINCHGKEKVRRFYEVFPEGKIDEFYSDSYSDTPLARLARKAYLVKGEKLLPWKKF